MNKVIDSLCEIMPPPPSPTGVVLDQYEAGYDLKLPSDYVDFIRTYGDGRVCDFLTVYNPFSQSKPFSMARRSPSSLESFRRFKDRIPFDLFPTEGGLFPWGMSDDGDDFFWITRGNPEDWTVCVHDRGVIEFYDEKMTFSQFLFDLLSRGGQSRFASPFFDDEPSFEAYIES